MKVGYFADGPWSHKALELLVDEVDIQFIVPRYDTQDPVLKIWSEKLGIPFIPTKNVNSPEFIANLKKYSSELFISMSFNQIVKKEIINLPPKGFINCHAGSLPFYRGRNPLNWVLINDEKSFGITTHYVDEGIDTGDIITKQEYKISDEDSYKTLLERATKECPNVLISAVKKIKNNNVTPIKQNIIHPVGTYFGRRIVGDEKINFNLKARDLFNFIRAITYPGPGARCFVNGREIAILKSQEISGAPSYKATCGEVVGRSDEGNIVKVGDSTLLITRYTEITGKNQEDIKVPKFPIGTRLHSAS